VYTPILKLDKGNMYAPRIRLKIPTKDGELAIKIYNEDRQRIELEDIVSWKDATVQAIVEIQQVWVFNNKFGVSLQANQFKVTPPAKKIEEYAFVTDDEDEAVQ
jgi:hypothetical protein